MFFFFQAPSANPRKPSFCWKGVKEQPEVFARTCQKRFAMLVGSSIKHRQAATVLSKKNTQKDWPYVCGESVCGFFFCWASSKNNASKATSEILKIQENIRRRQHQKKTLEAVLGWSLGEFVIGHRLSRLDYWHSGGTSDGTCTDAEGSITSALVGAATQEDLVFPLFLLKTDFKDYHKPHPTNRVELHSYATQTTIWILTAPVFSRLVWRRT